MGITSKFSVLPETTSWPHLRRLTLHRGTIAYTKYIVSKIGFASPVNGSMKEFALPRVPAPYYVSNIFNPIDILSIGANVWLSSLDSGSIARFNPSTRKVGYMRTANNKVAFASESLAKDTANRLWSRCYIKQDTGSPSPPVDPGLARVRTRGGRPRVEYWTLPIDFLSPNKLWTDEEDNIWFTVFDETPGGGQPSFGCLNPNTNELTGYYIGSHQSPVMSGITGTPDASEIWMTGESAYGNSRVYRFLNEPWGLHSYSHAAMALPNDIILPAPGKPYFTSSDGYVNKIIGNPTTREMLAKSHWVVPRDTLPLRTANFTAARSGAGMAPSFKDISPKTIVGPFMRWPVPAFGPSTPASLLMNDAGEVYFTDFFADELGLMTDF